MSRSLDEPIDSLNRTGTPILLLHGRHDMTFPVVLAEQAEILLDNATAVVLSQAGHMAHIDQPADWLTAVANFTA
jgi:pimeloyl-ACP methyl ester carboxylesterase